MRLLFSLLFLVIAGNCNAQYFWCESFELPCDEYRSRFVIDTNYAHNVWQIGRPNKSVFDTLSALSAPNVIITDTVNPYRAGDTSVFTITHQLITTTLFSLNFQYNLNIDSGTSAKIELSGDRGMNWIDMISEDTTYQFYWGHGKPRLDTSTAGWQPFNINMETWINAYSGGPDTFPLYRTSDTILFRFTFISDTDVETKDGWMMDDFFVENAFMEGSLKTVSSNDQIIISPNPSTGTIYIHSSVPNAKNTSIVVLDMIGRSVYSTKNFTSDISFTLPPGIYLIKYSDDKINSTKRIVIQ